MQMYPNDRVRTRVAASCVACCTTEMQSDKDEALWTPTSRLTTARLVERLASNNGSMPRSNTPLSHFFLAAPAEDKQQKIPLYSAKYFQACTIGGILACGERHAFKFGMRHVTHRAQRLLLHYAGPTHTSVTPLDVVKCNMQIDNNRYKGVGDGFRVTYREGGLGNIFRGWAPTFVGYSIQGAGKYGLYEWFKQ